MPANLSTRKASGTPAQARDAPDAASVIHTRFATHIADGRRHRWPEAVADRRRRHEHHRRAGRQPAGDEQHCEVDPDPELHGAGYRTFRGVEAPDLIRDQLPRFRAALSRLDLREIRNHGLPDLCRPSALSPCSARAGRHAGRRPRGHRASRNRRATSRRKRRPHGTEAPAPATADTAQLSGSQEAKDDIYCSALIYDENPGRLGRAGPGRRGAAAQGADAWLPHRRSRHQQAGRTKGRPRHARALISDAYADRSRKISRRRRPRISLDECNKRAAAIPVPQ